MARISMPPTTSPTRRGPSQPAASRGRNSRACCVRRSSGRPRRRRARTRAAIALETDA